MKMNLAGISADNRVKPTKRIVGSVSLVAVFVALLLSPQLKAYAAEPTIQVFPVNDNFIAPFASNFCGFDITRTDVGRLTLTTWYDQNGNISRQMVTDSITVTFSAHGQTLTGITAGQGTTTFYPDGSMTVLSTGPTVLTHAPGQGTVWGYTGSQTFYVSPTGDVTPIRESGNEWIGNPDFCAALTP